MPGLFRRLAVPLVGAGLVVIVVIVAWLVLDLGGPAGDSASSLPVIQIGGASTGQGQETATTQGQGVTPGPGTTIQSSNMTLVTGQIHVQPEPGHQGGSTSTTAAQAPTSTGGQGPTSTGGQGPTPTGGAQGPTPTGQGR